MEDAATRDDTKYSLGSVLNHVLMHQTIIGQEAKKQLEKADDAADIVIGCAGGGSNFAGLSFPFAADKLTGKNKKMRIIAVEPSACPSLTKGSYVYDFGDTVGLTPLVKMHTLGHTFIPAPLHAGGLRYHGMAPLVCKLYDEGVIEAMAVPQLATFEAAHAVRADARASSRRRSRRTPSASRSTRRSAASRKASGGRSSSISRATATSTWAPTRRTWPASSRTTSTRRRRSRKRCGACRRCERAARLTTAPSLR